MLWDLVTLLDQETVDKVILFRASLCKRTVLILQDHRIGWPQVHRHIPSALLFNVVTLGGGFRLQGVLVSRGQRLDHAQRTSPRAVGGQREGVS